MGIKFEGRGEKYRIAVMAILLAGACFLAYYFHAVLKTETIFTHFFYIPLILAALWWKRRGLVVAIFLAALLIFSHIFYRVDVTPTDDYFRAVMFIAIACVVAILSERMTKAEAGLKEYAENFERMVAERTKELRKEKRFSDNIIATIPDSLLVLDKDLRIKSANRSCYELFQAKPQQVLGSKITDIVGDEDGKLSAGLNKLFGTEDMLENFELHYQSEKLGERIFNMRARGIIIAEEEEEEEEEELITLQDITERKRAEEELRESERRFRDVVDNALEWIWETDVNGKYTYASPIIKKILGYEPEEVLRKHFYDVFHPEDREELKKAAFEAFAKKQPFHEFINRNVHKNGKTVWLLTSGVPILDAKGNLLGYRGADTDITERKQAEEALKQSEEKYRTILESIEEAYWEVDIAGNFTFFNNSICRILGYSRDEMMGMNNRVFTAEEDAKAVYKAFNKVFRTGKPIEGFSWKGFRKDGSRLFLESSVSVIRNQTGEIIGFRGVTRDITKRKEAEELTQALMQSSGTGIYIIQDGKFQYVNPLFQELTGYTEEELIGTYSLNLVHPEDRHAVRKKAIENLKGQSLYPYEYRCIKENGEAIWVLERVVSFEHRGKPAAIGSFMDITEIKQAEDALRQSEERYRTILESVEEGYWEVDIVGNFTFFNNSMCRILGYSRDEMMGMNNRVFTAEEDAKAVYEAFNKVFRTGKPVESVCGEIFRKDGAKRFLETSASPVRNREGEIIGFRGVMRDVTEHKSAEQQLLTTSKLASVGELAAGVAHELNNPLTGIIGYAQLLTSRGNVPLDVKADLDRIYQESQRAAKIVQNLLSFARQRKPHKDYFDVNELIQKTLELRSYELRTSNIGIYVNLAPGLPLVIADYHQMQQVLLNIIMNAEQAIAEGKHRGKITLTTTTVEGHVEISIADDGPGIAKEDIGKVFDPFFTTKEVGSGTGLGLSVCHGIVAQHGGKIYVESRKGKGATFTIELPLTTQDKAVVEEEDRPLVKKSQPGKRKTTGRILVVDDEPAVCDVLGRALSDGGYVTDSALSAKSALEKMAGNNYELYIIDLKMPRTSGKELYEIMKQRYPSSAEKVVFITGDTITRATQNFLASAGKPYLAKPFDSKQIIELVEETLGGGQ